MNTGARFYFKVALLIMSLAIAGCNDKKEKKVERPPGTVDDVASLHEARKTVAMSGTVGSVSYLQGGRFMRVRGYGLVWGLRGTGSRFCPPEIRESVLREIRRARMANLHVERQLSAEELVDSINTAVVEITGDIPAGVPKGTLFDVVVDATAVSPDTKSLEGGYLLPSELRIFREAAPGRTIEGKVHARARGPVFLNPFVDPDSRAAGTNLTRGRLLGGGLNVFDRRLSLHTTIESYATVESIANAINRRFIAEPKVAVAMSAGMVKLNLPPEVKGKEGRFIALLRHLPLSASAMVQEARAKVLIEELQKPGLPPEDAALSLEGIGPSIIPLLQELYAYRHPQTSYYAAQTGLRLEDKTALAVIRKHANDPKSPFRLRAIRELGYSGMKERAGEILRQLLDDEDPQIVIAAYEALRRVDRESLVTVVIGREPGNFLLDIVPSEDRCLIYARRTGVRRIALIGANHMVLNLPVFYEDTQRNVTISGKADDAFLTILRREADVLIGEFHIVPSVLLLARFLGDDPKPQGNENEPKGLGLDYAVVLETLYGLCESGTINAEMRWEEPSVEDLVGPLRPMGRPESDL